MIIVSSNFLSGTADFDVFLLDRCNGETTWAAITDWQPGEQFSIRGWHPGVSRTHRADFDEAGGTRAPRSTPTEQDALLRFA